MAQPDESDRAKFNSLEGKLNRLGRNSAFGSNLGVRLDLVNTQSGFEDEPGIFSVMRKCLYCRVSAHMRIPAHEDRRGMAAALNHLVSYWALS